MISIRRTTIAFGFIAIFLSLALGCAKNPRQITLALNWFPEVEHGGYYAALVHGYYKEAGLDVKIIAGGPDVPVIARVASGAATFGVENADAVLLGRAEQANVVALMAPIQDSPRCIMVHEESGILDLADLRNVTLGMSAKGAFSHYLRKHVRLADVRIIPYSGSVSQFLLDPRYAQQAYVFSELYLARKEGANARALMLSDIGFNPYTSVLIGNEKTLAESPDIVSRFVKASLRGWKQYLQDPEETNRRIQQLNPALAPDVLAYGVETLRPLTGGAEMGSMTRERWSSLLEQLVDLEMIKKDAVAVEAAYTTRFLAP